MSASIFLTSTWLVCWGTFMSTSIFLLHLGPTWGTFMSTSSHPHVTPSPPPQTLCISGPTDLTSVHRDLSSPPSNPLFFLSPTNWPFFMSGLVFFLSLCCLCLSTILPSFCLSFCLIFFLSFFLFSVFLSVCHSFLLSGLYVHAERERGRARKRHAVMPWMRLPPFTFPSGLKTNPFHILPSTIRIQGH